MSRRNTIFVANGYPRYCFDKILRRFFNSHRITKNSDNNPNDDYSYYVIIPYFRKESRKFAQCIMKLIKIKFGRKIILIYKTFKINRYFQLKSKLCCLCAQMSYTNLFACVIRSRHTSVCPPDIWTPGSGSISISTVYKIAQLKPHYVM